MAPCVAHAHQAPPSALDLAVQSAHRRGYGHGCGARDLWAPCTSALGPHCLLENQPPRPLQITPAQSCASSWRNAAGWDPCSPATPPATRGTAPYAPPLSPHRSASAWHRPLAGLGHIGQLAPWHHVKPPAHGQYSQQDGSIATLQLPFLGLQITIPRVAYVLRSEERRV